jgi:hypothetical protein
MQHRRHAFESTAAPATTLDVLSREFVTNDLQPTASDDARRANTARMTPARNRVTPTGDIVAIPLRGAWTGNRGILHSGRRIVRFHASDLWITCALEFRGRHHEQWRPHHYTFLFFHDEAVSLAAGHRPCAECRRESYEAYRTAWARSLGGEVPSAKELNRQLHGERIVRGTHRRRIHRLPWTELPDGAFVLLDASPAVVVGDQLTGWTHEGYRDRLARPTRGDANVITPPSTVAALRAGYTVQIDASARRAG